MKISRALQTYENCCSFAFCKKMATAHSQFIFFITLSSIIYCLLSIVALTGFLESTHSDFRNFSGSRVTFIHFISNATIRIFTPLLTFLALIARCLLGWQSYWTKIFFVVSCFACACLFVDDVALFLITCLSDTCYTSYSEHYLIYVLALAESHIVMLVVIILVTIDLLSIYLSPLLRTSSTETAKRWTGGAEASLPLVQRRDEEKRADLFSEGSYSPPSITDPRSSEI